MGGPPYMNNPMMRPNPSVMASPDAMNLSSVDVYRQKHDVTATGHQPSAINVQIYRLIKEWATWDIARRVVFAFFGIFVGTKENPEFLQDVPSKLDKNSKIIVACSYKGTMKSSSEYYPMLWYYSSNVVNWIILTNTLSRLEGQIGFIQLCIFSIDLENFAENIEGVKSD
ncbi:unnamed protein product [Lactuca virosa]|uniref:Uncharacterized protein n=1 Tax=Lactuca virosa TaxID=75947 RepID=A0AAU9ND24_9ASTR|nr:unnamed protein product [Lactuca virosa]